MIAAALLSLATMSLDNRENRCRTANTGAKQRSGISVHPMALFISQRTITGRVIYHGGGSGLANPYAPYQGWVPTLGCLRMQNADGIEVSNWIIANGNNILLEVVD